MLNVQQMSILYRKRLEFSHQSADTRVSLKLMSRFSEKHMVLTFISSSTETIRRRGACHKKTIALEFRRLAAGAS